MLVSSSSPGQFSLGGEGSGGLFINQFMDTFYTLAPTAGASLTWTAWLTETRTRTEAEAMLYDNPQTPQFEIAETPVAEPTPDPEPDPDPDPQTDPDPSTSPPPTTRPSDPPATTDEPWNRTPCRSRARRRRAAQESTATLTAGLLMFAAMCRSVAATIARLIAAG